MQLSQNPEAVPPSPPSRMMTQADLVRHTVLAALSRRTQWSLRSFRIAVDTAINEAGITRRGLARTLGLSLSMVARAVDVTDRRISCVHALAQALGYYPSDDEATAVFRARSDTNLVPPVPSPKTKPDPGHTKEIVIVALSNQPPMTPQRFAVVIESALNQHHLTKLNLAKQCDIAVTTIWSALVHGKMDALTSLGRRLGYVVDGGMFRRATR
jgi:hypothetical protein